MAMCRLPLFMLMSVVWVFTGAIAPSAPALSETQAGSQVLFRPSGSGPPPTTRGAGSRSDRLCPQDASTPTQSSTQSSTQLLTLTALIPTDQSGLTGADHSTFWVYLPKTTARQMVLSVKGPDSQPHSQRFLPITEQAEIVGIPLDTNAPPLELDTSYQWAVVLICGDRPSPNDPFVTGWVRRVTPSAMNKSQSPLERATAYGEQRTIPSHVKSHPMFTNFYPNFYPKNAKTDPIATPILVLPHCKEKHYKILKAPELTVLKLFSLARPGRLELPTSGFGDLRSTN